MAKRKSRKQPETPLEAVVAGDLDRLRKLIAEGADVNEFEEETALAKAAELGSEAMVKELLKAGADVNFGGLSVPLCAAAASGNPKVVKLLLDAGAKIDAQEEEGITPLMSAAAGGHLEIIQMLVKAGADPQAVDSDGESALDKAMRKRRAEGVKFLKQYASDAKQASLERQAHLLREEPAKKSPQPKQARQAAKKPEAKKKGPSPLTKAFERSELDVAAIRAMIAEGANVETTDSTGNTALCLACGRLYRDREEASQIVQILLAAGADPNRRGEMFAPLHMASMYGTTNVIRMLLDAGADVNGRDFKGRTPLMHAADDDNLNALKMLLAAGADVNAEDEDGHNALWHALECGAQEAANLLRPLTADTESADKPWRREQFGSPELRLIAAAGGGDLETVRGLLKAGVKPDAADESGNTAIHKAAAAGHLNVIKELLKARVPVDLPGLGGRSPLQNAAGGGHLQVVEFLLKSKAQVNRADEYGQTPLWEAAKALSLPVAERLLAAGANVNVATRGTDGTTPFLQAVGRSEAHRQMMRLLVKHGADVRAIDTYGRSALALADRDLGREDADARALRELFTELGLIKADSGRLTKAAGEGDFETVSRLLKAGTSPDALDEQERTALYMAVSRRRPEIVALLLKAGANPNKPIGRDDEGDSQWGGIEVPCPKCKAATMGMVILRQCPKCGGRFDTRKVSGTRRLDLPLYVSWTNGFTPLMAAAKLGDAKIARMLIDARAKVDRGIGEITPLIGACQFGHIEVAKLLIEKGADIKKVARTPRGGSDKVTAVKIAANAGHIELVKLLWDAGVPAQDRNQTLLVDAARRGDVRAIRSLLKAGGDPNKPDPLTDDAPLAAAATAGYLDAVEALIDAGATAAKSASIEFPPLMTIAEKFQRGWVAEGDVERYLAMARKLIDAGARATISVFGITPLSLAEESECRPLIEMLRAAAEREKAAKKPKR